MFSFYFAIAESAVRQSTSCLSVNVQRGLNVGMPEQFLLNGWRRPKSVQECRVGVAKGSVIRTSGFRDRPSHIDFSEA
jgi:hypothetical protein